MWAKYFYYFLQMHLLVFHQFYKIQNYFSCSWPNDCVSCSSLLLLEELRLYCYNSSCVTISTLITQKLYLSIRVAIQTSEQQLSKGKTLWISSYRLELWIWVLTLHTRLMIQNINGRGSNHHVELLSYAIIRNKTFPSSNCLVCWKQYFWSLWA